MKLMGLPKFPQEMHQLMVCLRDRLSGKMTSDELNLNCANWAYYNCFEEFIPLPIESKPAMVAHFDTLSLVDKKKMSEKAVAVALGMRAEWLEKKHIVKIQNQSNYLWLKEMERIFEKAGDVEKLEVVRRRIDVYDR